MLKMTVELLVPRAGRTLQREREEGTRQWGWREVERPGAVLCTAETARNRTKRKICTGC